MDGHADTQPRSAGKRHEKGNTHDFGQMKHRRWFPGGTVGVGGALWVHFLPHLLAADGLTAPLQRKVWPLGRMEAAAFPERRRVVLLLWL